MSGSRRQEVFDEYDEHRAAMVCENNGNDPTDHFYRAVTMVAIGSNTKRAVNNSLTAEDIDH